MKMKKLLALLLALAMLVAMTACGSDAASSAAESTAAASEAAPAEEAAAETYTIGICQLVRHDALDAATQGFKDALTEKLSDSVTLTSRTLPAIPPTAPPSSTASCPATWI